MISIKVEELQLFRASKEIVFPKKILSIPFLELEYGDVIGIYGPNHVGKTSFLRYLSRIDHGFRVHECSNTTFFCPKGSEKKPDISYVPQDFSGTILPWFGVEVNIRSFSIAKGLSEEEIESSVNSVVKYLGESSERKLLEKYGFLSSGKLKKIYELSGGQKQMLAILRSLVVKPNILLMDEPFSAIDMYKGRNFREKVISGLKENDVTVIIVSHTLEELLELTDKIIFLRHGGNGGEFTGIASRDEWNNIPPSDVIDALVNKYA